MNRLKSSPGAKIGAYLLLVAFACTFAISSFHLVNCYERDYLGTDYFNTAQFKQRLSADYNDLSYYLSLHEKLPVARNEQTALGDGFDAESYEGLSKKFAPGEPTNFLFQAEDKSGTLILTNYAGSDFESKLHEVFTTIYAQGYSISYGVDSSLTANDEYRMDSITFQEYSRYIPLSIICAVASFVLGLLLFIFSLSAAGHKRGCEGIYLNVIDRIYFDIYCVLTGCAVYFVLFFIRYWGYYPSDLLLYLIPFSVLGSIAFAFFVTFATRVKAGTLFKATFIYLICHGIAQIFRSLRITWKVIIVFICYAVICELFLGEPLLFLLFQLAVLCSLCFFAIQAGTIKKGGQRIAAGDLEYQIDTGRMYWDLKQHAENLNDISGGMRRAIDEQMKSERFRAELITNVSHDIKTPLTSIINYIDLLKKEGSDNPKVNEYIEVIDRKSQWLKKLTEDLVEASKASTGNITINRERIGVTELIRQSLGEFSEKLEEHQLEVISDMPAQEVYISADGRHIWRIIDNLLSNIYKYALPNTRVYLTVHQTAGNVIFSVKNISASRLNISAEELMERFVRGDESRTTEGSGLGLSIAQNLTELQGGTFTLDIDGDLFKATVLFPASESD